jgi:hypothetical protein
MKEKPTARGDILEISGDEGRARRRNHCEGILDPGKGTLGRSLKRNHGGGVIETETWSTHGGNREGGIIEEASWRMSR